MFPSTVQILLVMDLCLIRLHENQCVIYDVWFEKFTGKERFKSQSCLVEFLMIISKLVGFRQMKAFFTL